LLPLGLAGQSGDWSPHCKELSRISAQFVTMKNGNQRFKVKRTSSGFGLVTLKPIPKGKRIVEYTGPLVSNTIVDRSNGKYFFGINSKWSIDGSPRDNLARYINHSCRPNAEAIQTTRRRVWIWSKRALKPGEEITYDYGKEYFEGIIKPVGCRCTKCGSSRTKR
jgi:SET domain-containing protein